MKKLSVKIVKGLLSFGTAAVALSVAPDVFAQANLANSVTSIHSGMSAIPNIIAGACYIGGAAVLGAGLMKLKNHAENPGQTPLGHGVGRVCMGGALLAAPAIGTWVQNSIGTGSQSASSMGFSTIN